MTPLRPFHLLAALGALGAASMALSATQVIGIASVVVNSVSIRSNGAAQGHAAAVRERVALADQVQTGAASRLQLILLDHSVFTVGANARLTIDRFVYDPRGSTTAATVAKGAFRFISGGGAHRGSSINTPVASIGIRGTILDGVVGEEAMEIAAGERALGRDPGGDPQTATLVVLRGPGPQHEGNAAAGALDVTAAGRTVMLDEPLLAAYVPRAGTPPIGPFALSLPGLARLNALIIPTREVTRPASGEPLPVPQQRQPRRGPMRGDFGPGPVEGGLGGDGPTGGFGVPGGFGLPGERQLPPRPMQTPPRTSQTPAVSPSPSPSPTPGRNPNSIP